MPREIHDTKNVYSFDGMFKGATLFSNEATLYYIKKFQMKGSNRVVIVSGYLKNTAPNIPYRIKGKWSYNSKYENWTIKVEDFETIKEELSEKDTIKYLSSELFSGIGPTTAAKIYEEFGDKSIGIAENEPEKLLVIKGITQRKINIIAESFKRNKYLKFIISELGSKGFSFNLCQKIYSEYEEKSLEVIKEKPYSLAYDVSGIGFKKADEIALAYDNIKYHDIERIKAAIFFSIKTKCEAEGHTYVEFDDILENTKNLLNTQPNDYITFKELNDALISLCQDKRLVLREGHLYLMSLYKAERDSIQKTIDLIKADSKTNFSKSEIEDAIKWYETKNKLSLAPEQKSAIIKSLSNSFSVITGYPGTGKSFTIKGIIEVFKYLFEHKYSEIYHVVTHRPDPNREISENDDGTELLTRITSIEETCAPTGKAARRIEESTGYKSKTIHRYLEVDGVTKGFKRNEDNPFEAGLIVVDEVSMVDIRLYSSFINAVQKGKTKVVLVGDPDQLPSVGPGNVLHDLIAAENYIPITRLTAIFRQAETSNIVKNSHKIRQYEKGTTLTNSKKDFQMYYLNDEMSEESIFQFILNKYKEEMKEFNDIQILCPAKKESVKVSSTNLNPLLSQIANPSHQKGPTVKKGEKTVFHVDDKVIQTKNNYNKDVFNGDTGFIKRIKDGVITIQFANVEADYISAEEFDLAYAMTVHRSQGSEFDCVIVPVLRSNTFMLNKSLIYTAITRAKKKVVLIAHKQTLDRALKKLGNKRNTSMTADLQVYYNTGRLPNFVDFTQEDIKKLGRIDLFKKTEEYE